MMTTGGTNDPNRPLLLLMERADPHAFAAVWVEVHESSLRAVYGEAHVPRATGPTTETMHVQMWHKCADIEAAQEWAEEVRLDMIPQGWFQVRESNE
jgi:hypothetical protein